MENSNIVSEAVVASAQREAKIALSFVVDEEIVQIYKFLDSDDCKFSEVVRVEITEFLRFAFIAKNRNRFAGLNIAGVGSTNHGEISFDRSDVTALLIEILQGLENPEELDINAFWEAIRATAYVDGSAVAACLTGQIRSFNDPNMRYSRNRDL